MEIETTRFGRIEIDNEKVITFTREILGFPSDKRYVLFPHRSGSAFYWLQSVDTPWLAFVVMSPQVFCSDYVFELPDSVQKELRLERAEQAFVMVIVTIPKGNPDEITANLLAPLVINMDERLACQVVLDPSMYPVRFPIVKKDACVMSK
ncbi:MAG: flagellar assembly protein FliW [Dissulfurimicrobium sp.]|uniref:flagellar assembly protein FliW n=1 Tax=Dissulfurimicrobium TaxID=1769732 RepID=UPI001EDA7759|nr:flagellar assembly protein FliW [Dissulfurimicrobium hydrothermale]UKL13708.1 flagellar assembly protein FliW [Dissulfurimicrobium hydrothermale]